MTGSNHYNCTEYSDNKRKEMDLSGGKDPKIDSGIADYSDKSLISLPQEILKLNKLSELYLSENLFSEFPIELLNLTNLKVLDISGNILTALPQNIFEIKNLVHLNISRNKLTVLPREILNLEELSELYLSENLFSEFPVELLNLNKLMVLDISRNNISDIRISDIQRNTVKKILEDSDLGNLQTLYLNENSLSSIDEIVPYIKKLQRLNLRRNNFDSLSYKITDLRKLLYLDLSENNLTSISEHISKLNLLEELYLCGNSLHSLTREINDLTYLKTLSISGNKLEDLNNGLPKSLNNLDLRGNAFTKFPQQISELKDLQNLYLGGNELSEFECEISNLINLRNLDLRDNAFSKFPTEILVLTQLTDLDLSKNILKTIPADVSNLRELRNLDLEGNELESIPTGILRLKNLQKLNLKGNNLTDIPPQISELKYLQKLDLRGNKLTNLPESILSLKNLTTLYLDGNNFLEFPTVLKQNNLNNKIDIDISEDAFSPQYQKLKAIQIKAEEILCKKSQGTDKSEIIRDACTDILEWEIDGSEEMTRNLERLISDLELEIPNTSENKHIFDKIEALKDEEDVEKQLSDLSSLLTLISQEDYSRQCEILRKIQEKAKVICNESQGTSKAEIICGICREISEWKIDSPEKMTQNFEWLISHLKLKIPNIPENEHIFDEIDVLKNEEDITKQFMDLFNLLILISQYVDDNVSKKENRISLIKWIENSFKTKESFFGFIHTITFSVFFPSLTASGALAACCRGVCVTRHIENMDSIYIDVFIVCFSIFCMTLFLLQYYRTGKS